MRESVNRDRRPGLWGRTFPARATCFEATMNRTMLDTTSRLPPALASAASARHLVRDALTQAGVDCWATVDTAMLLVSEVVTNAVVHAHTPVEVHIAVRGPVVRIEARDGSTTPPRLPHVD